MSALIDAECVQRKTRESLLLSEDDIEHINTRLITLMGEGFLNIPLVRVVNTCNTSEWILVNKRDAFESEFQELVGVSWELWLTCVSTA